MNAAVHTRLADRCFFFFFQAEDGIRDYKVTGVQTCALPIYEPAAHTEEVFLAPETVSIDLPSLPTSDFPNEYPGRGAETVPLETVPLQPFTHEVESSAAWQREQAPTEAVPPPVPHYPAPAAPQEGVRPRAPRGALGEDVKKGLGKVREISTVVIDEASYDPSARFVLVAAVLFVLFLVILILSEMMR